MRSVGVCPSLRVVRSGFERADSCFGGRSLRAQNLNGVCCRSRSRFDNHNEIEGGVEETIVKKRTLSPQNKGRERGGKKEKRRDFRNILGGSVYVSEEREVLGEREGQSEKRSCFLL